MKLSMKSFFQFFSILFFSSIPLMPLYTIDVHRILGAICVMMYAFSIIINFFKNKKIERLSIFEVLYLFLIIYAWKSISPFLSLKKIDYLYEAQYIVKTMLFNILSVIAATRLIFFKQEDIKKSILLIGNVITISTILVSTYSIIYEYIYLMKFSRLGTYLFAGQYGTRMTYTYNLTISIFFLLFNILNNINKRKSIIYLFLILIFSILSGTRKLFLIMLVFVTFYYIFSKKVNPAFLIKTLIFGSIFLTISTVLMFNVPIFYEMFGSRVESLIIQIQTGEGDSSSWERNLMVKHGKKYFETNKMSGIGTNGFKYAFGLDTKIYKYSHNNYIEVAVNFGVKGLLLFYGGIIIILIRLLIYKRGNIDELRNLFISIILSLMVSDYYTVTYYQIHFLLIFILASFYSFNVNKRNKKNNVEV